ncbi:response regulator [Mariprofundus sp. EBB-1]|uniref:response regulator n=1 Tax=Mariprofundus sp. EBB-1 TaxID=2650971 RepID=UPI000EF25443|nr:response regulator [Mariprofundus sp. EBB-1]RLL53563.1 response regulator [Mariprofundus sp. EBB-1]
MPVYIVDDNLDLGEIMAFVLSDAGYLTHVFTCPVAALDHMQSNAITPSMLITDYNMPKMNGYELHMAVHIHAPDVKTIIMSGRFVQEKIGDLPFMQKPFSPGHLLTTVEAVKGSSAPI